MAGSERSRPLLTIESARLLVEHALQAGVNANVCLSLAVVDAGGHLLAFLRSEDAFLGSIDAAIAKARTAVYFQRDTAAMQQGLEKGKTAYLALAGALPLEGGVPLFSQGVVVGGLGISGAASAKDGELAQSVASRLGFCKATA